MANWLIKRANDAGTALTPLQVIKLVYFAHGWTLAFYRRPLFRQPVEAWPYGPVIADVYHNLKQYRANPIGHVIPGIPETQFYDQELDVMEEVYRVYGDFSGIRLSALTHHEGSPWEKTIQRFGRGSTIDNEVIRSHFEELASVGG